MCCDTERKYPRSYTYLPTTAYVVEYDMLLYLSTVLFSYKITYKVATWYTPYQLVYGLHPLMPTQYIVPVVGGNEKDSTLVRVLTNRITELKKLQETKMQKLEKFNNGLKHYGVNKRIQKNN
jgi:hypothetical protein